MPKAYPVYDAGYDERVEVIRACAVCFEGDFGGVWETAKVVWALTRPE